MSTAPNIQALYDWAENNRPDIVGHLKQIVDNGDDALMFLLTIGFEAGRQYQIDHPKHGILSFHSDPAFMHQPPVKTSDKAA